MSGKLGGASAAGIVYIQPFYCKCCGVRVCKRYNWYFKFLFLSLSK